MDKEQVSDTSKIPDQTTPGSLYVVFKYVAIGMGILGIGFLIALAGFMLAQSQKVKTEGAIVQSRTLTPTVTPKDLTSTITDTGVADQKLYTNPKLGISFIYPEKFMGEPMAVKEAGNKIYVYFTKYPYTQGQYVESYDKESGDSLDQSIQKQFLSNISVNDCYVKSAKPDSQANFASSFEVKTLGFPVDQNSDLPFFAQANKCPVPYAQSNGLSYFLGDTKHPKIFLFFSIGQQEFPIDDNSKLPWQDTIKFLD